MWLCYFVFLRVFLWVLLYFMMHASIFFWFIIFCFLLCFNRQLPLLRVDPRLDREIQQLVWERPSCPWWKSWSRWLDEGRSSDVLSEDCPHQSIPDAGGKWEERWHFTAILWGTVAQSIIATYLVGTYVGKSLSKGEKKKMSRAQDQELHINSTSMFSLYFYVLIKCILTSMLKWSFFLL